MIVLGALVWTLVTIAVLYLAARLDRKELAPPTTSSRWGDEAGPVIYDWEQAS